MYIYSWQKIDKILTHFDIALCIKYKVCIYIYIYYYFLIFFNLTIERAIEWPSGEEREKIALLVQHASWNVTVPRTCRFWMLNFSLIVLYILRWYRVKINVKFMYFYQHVHIHKFFFPFKWKSIIEFRNKEAINFSSSNLNYHITIMSAVDFFFILNSAHCHVMGVQIFVLWWFSLALLAHEKCALSD